MFLQEGQEIANPDPTAGLYIQPRNNNNNNNPVKVVIPTDCCAFQIGETSQILSGGLLRATPHAVLAGTRTPSSLMTNVTRESFALFLQPNEDFVLNLPTTTTTTTVSSSSVSSEEDMFGSIPQRPDLEPIASRWRNGQTFGAFHWATIQKFVVQD
jgi:isopenicillin N synthase-like dioxygenase